MRLNNIFFSYNSETLHTYI